MKFRVSFKTPDAVDAAIDSAMIDSRGADREALEGVVEKFVQYGENITVEFDTKAGTATVLPVR